MNVDEQDAKVIDAVARGANRLRLIRRDIGGFGDGTEIDTVLQRLRKASKIAYASEPGWHIPSKPKLSR